MSLVAENQARLMKPGEAAKFLNMSEATLWRNTSPRGPIRRVKIGSTFRYDRLELERLIDNSLGIEDAKPAA